VPRLCLGVGLPGLKVAARRAPAYGRAVGLQRVEEMTPLLSVWLNNGVVLLRTISS